MAEAELSNLTEKAKIAEQTERYEDMVIYIEEVVNMRHQTKEDLSKEERNLLSVAYKNVIGSRRAAWRITSSIQQKQSTRDNPDAQKLSIIKEYKLRVEKELDDKCEQILAILDRCLLAESEGIYIMSESKVFYHKMKGDYYRYMAEYKTGDERKLAADKASEAYKEAQSIASRGDKDGLPSTHPIRLGLALNYSVFLFEIQNNPEEACKLAKKAFDESISELDSLKEDSYKDSTLIMQLLRDNLTLWSSEIQNEFQDDEGHD